MGPRKVFAIFLSLFLIFYPTLLYPGLKEIGFYTGRGRAGLLEKDDYEIIILAGRFGFDMNPWFKNKIKGLLTFSIEPFLNPIISPDSNVEFGTHFMLRYGYPLRIFMPYLEGGTGFMYTTQHTREQSTQWNFSSQAGIGVFYFLGKNLALNFSYRYRHFSNCSLKHPNKGVDIHQAIMGISWFFD